MAGRPTKRLSDAGIRNLKKPGRHSDGDQLWLQVSKWETKSWLFQYSMRGSKRVRQMGLGPYPDVSLAEARSTASNARKLVRDGLDPIEFRRENAASKAADSARLLTFKKCAEDYLRKRELEWDNKKHRAQWYSTLSTYVYPKFGHLFVRDIADVHVLQVVEPLWHTKNETARRICGRIASILEYAKHRKLRTGDNPALWNNLRHALPKPSAVTKVRPQRSMPYDELPAFMSLLRQRQGVAARALEWAILTATRTGAARGASWSEIKQIPIGPNKRISAWVIDPSRPGLKLYDQAKDKPPRAPLSKRLLEILEALHPQAESAFLFPGAQRGRPLSDMAMLELLRGMIPHPDKPSTSKYVVHGFRASFRTWAAEMTDYPSEVCEAALWHAVADKTVAAYNRGDFIEKRVGLMEDWARFCGGGNSAQVIDQKSGTFA